jgi:IS30 family transposase
VNHRAIRLLRQQPHPVHTLTCDNGTEFHGYAAVEAAWKPRGSRNECPLLLRHAAS